MTSSNQCYQLDSVELLHIKFKESILRAVRSLVSTNTVKGDNGIPLVADRRMET